MCTSHRTGAVDFQEQPVDLEWNNDAVTSPFHSFCFFSLKVWKRHSAHVWHRDQHHPVTLQSLGQRLEEVRPSNNNNKKNLPAASKGIHGTPRSATLFQHLLTCFF